MQKKRWLMLTGVVGAVLALAFLVAACDDNGDGNGNGNGEAPTATEAVDTEPDATETPAAEGTQLDISAEDLSSFSTESLEAVAGEPFTVVFDNRDGSGVPHNFAIYTDESASEKIAATEIEPGPLMQELPVEGLEAGEYYYQCDVHPTTMTGTLTVQ